MKHPLEGKTFTVTILDPTDDSPKHKLYYFWNLPKGIEKSFNSDKLSDDAKRYIRGGEKEFDFDNIDETKLQLTQEVLEEVVLNKKNYFTKINIYPEDSFWNLKQKIFISTGIPIYRQHLFVKQGEIHKTAYNILIQESDYPISRTKDTNKVMGIKVDLTLYSNRDFLQIRTEETYTTLDEYINEKFYMYDLNDYLASINKSQILNDPYQFSVIHNSVIKKYFPVMDDSMFKKYLEDESTLIKMYPLLNMPKKYLEEKFNAEHQILKDVYLNSEKYKKMYNLSMEINTIEIFCSGLGNTLAIRNLVDVLKMSSTYNAIDSYISNGQSKYRVIKHWLGLENYIVQQIINSDEDYFGKDFLIVYVFDGTETHNLFIYSDGSYKFVGIYLHTHDITLDNILENTENLVQPLIDIINNNSQYLFAKLQPYVKKNLEFQKINLKLKWNKQYTDMQFNKIDELMNTYYTSGIFDKRNIAARPNTITAKVTKGITKNNVRLYLKKGVETKDYYTIFKDQKINETWNNRYSGENLEIINTLVNIIFELHGMTVAKFNRSLNYILQLIHEIDTSIVDDNIKKVASKSGKKKKFRDIDPELYDFEDDKGTKYARICQKKHRPIDILTEEQYNSLKESDKKNIFPFINYTTGEPVYYKCSDKLPYAGFIVNKHPKGLCIPKCKESDTNGIKNKQIWELCMNKKKVEKGQLETKTHNDNILKFGKIVDEGKYGHMHDSVLTVLDIDRDEFLLIGYPKYFTKINGGYVLDILAFQLEVQPINLIDKLIESVTQDMWNTVTTTNIKLEDFINLLNKFKINEVENQLNWSDVFIELSSMVFDVHFIIFETIILQTAELLTRTNSSIKIKYTDITKFSITSKKPIKFCIITELYGAYYPMNVISYEYRQKIFDETTKINKKICKIISNLESSKTANTSFEYINLSKIFKIKTKYVWQKRINYVELEDSSIIGCHNSVNFTDGVHEIHEMLNINKINSSFESVMEAIAKVYNEVPIFICTNSELNKVKNCYDCKFVGCRVGEVCCWFNPVGCESINKFYKKFDIELMNYDLHDVNLSIIQNRKPVMEYMQDINQIYYKAYIYKMFKYEFYKILLLYKKSQKKFISKLKSNELSEYIQLKKDKYKYSYQKINKILRYSENPEKDIKSMIIYEDVFELRNIIAKYNAKKLMSVVQSYVTKIDKVDDFPISNIIYSPIQPTKIKITDTLEFEWFAEDKTETLFYKGGKLKVLDLESMVSLLIKDLNNELYFIYEITDFQLMFIINYLNFRNHDDEKIIIQSL